MTLDLVTTFYSYLFFKRFCLFFREWGKEGEREGEKHQCVVASHTPPTGDLACSAGMCPDWESNQWPFGRIPPNPLSNTSQGGDNFLDTMSKAWPMRKILSSTSLNFKMSPLWGGKKSVLREQKDKPQTRRKYLQNLYLIKDWYPKSVNDSQNSRVRKQTMQLKNGQKIWMDTSPKKMYGCQMSTRTDAQQLVIRKLQTETMSYHSALMRTTEV